MRLCLQPPLSALGGSLFHELISRSCQGEILSWRSAFSFIAPTSIYEDSPAERYQFPSQYLARVEACVGDWIIYYEPRKALELRGYFALAKIQQVIRDPNAPSMYLAVIEPGSYLDFVNPVPFRDDGGVIERGLLNEEGKISGRAQSAVRPISLADFNRITEQGFPDDIATLPRVDASSAFPGMQESQSVFQHEQERNRVAYLTSRIVRDRVFRRNVLQAYRIPAVRLHPLS